MKLVNLIPNDKEVLFVCIGTDRSSGDCLGPLVGTWLKEKGYTVMGTLNDPLHALNLEKGLEDIQSIYPNHFLIAIDACLGLTDNIGKLILTDGPLRPGAALKKELPLVGDISIKGVVNVGGYMEYEVLQATRLNIVWELAKEIEKMCDMSMKNIKNNSRRRDAYLHKKKIAEGVC